MAQWLKALTDSYRGPRHYFIFVRWWELWEDVACLGGYTWSPVPSWISASHEGFAQPQILTCCPIQTEAWQPWALSEIGNPHESHPVRFFPQIFDGQITPHPPALMIPCPLHSIVVTKALSIFKASGQQDSVLKLSFSFVSSCTSVEKQ